ncbi:hypothetical protein GQ600_23516 [Phytophthora cactorum]|nr:hypothetical protein GQ600_23516 [Phytophthora cactorum]
MGWDYDSSSSSSCSESSTDMAYGDSSVHSDNEEWKKLAKRRRAKRSRLVLRRGDRSSRGIFTRKFPTFEEAREFLNQYGLQVDHEYQHFDCSRLWFAYAMNVETSQTLSTPVLLWPSVG